MALYPLPSYNFVSVPTSGLITYYWIYFLLLTFQLPLSTMSLDQLHGVTVLTGWQLLGDEGRQRDKIKRTVPCKANGAVSPASPPVAWVYVNERRGKSISTLAVKSRETSLIRGKLR